MSDSDDLVCLSKRPGLPNLWECRKIIKNYIEVAIGRGEQPTFDGVLTVILFSSYFFDSFSWIQHLGRIYDGDIKGDEKLLKKLQDKYDKLAEELAKNSAVLKASKPLDRNGNLTEADLCTLEEKEWLNDAIINEYLKLVVKNQKATGIRNFSSRCFIFDKIDFFDQTLVTKLKLRLFFCLWNPGK